MSNSSEINNQGSESGVEVSKSASEQMEKLSKSPENQIELSPRDAEAAAERARVEALETAISVEAGGAEKKKPRDSARQKSPTNKKTREASFKKQIKEVQAELSPASRTFSKLIHNKAIEKSSEALGATIARPNAILAGSISSFVLTLVVYLVAKNIGYQLSGFETIAAFIFGWIIGLVYDYLRLIITGKK